MRILKNEDGGVLVLVTVMMVVLFAFAALVVDVGLVYQTKGNLQNAADAAALAGAQDLPSTTSANSAAVQYAQQNNVNGSNTSVTTPFDGDETKIEVVTTKTVPFMFAKVLGFTETEVSARAVAKKTSQLGGFAVFQGGKKELIFNGGGISVNGSVHTNGTFKANGEGISVSDIAQAVGSIIIDGSPITITNQVKGADHQPLSDYVQSIGLHPGLVNSELGSAVTVSGDKEISSNPSQNIYAKGKVEIKKSGLHLTHSIIADGDIYIDAENLVLDSPIIYSKNGKIEVKKGNVVINGTLYSPKSEIIVNNSGAPVTVNGSIIGDFIRLNGPGISVNRKASSTNGVVRLIQ